MDEALAEIVRLLRPEALEQNIFRGQSRDIGLPQVFGGQVLGQALAAAAHTVEDRFVHSLHAYFLRRGDPQAPIIYEVDRARDGMSFSARRVVAIQRGVQIFNMAASFQRPETGLEHEATMPELPGPEGLPDLAELAARLGERLPERSRRVLQSRRAFLIRPIVPADLLADGSLAPVKRLWIRACDALPEDPLLHAALLAYVSDYELIGTAVLPHGGNAARRRLRMASLDHAMWFHRPLRVDRWMLFDFVSPSASGARGLVLGQVWGEDGALLASLAQEGLIRPRSSAAG